MRQCDQFFMVGVCALAVGLASVERASAQGACTPPPPTSPPAYDYEVIAIEGMQAEGMPAGTPFDAFFATLSIDADLGVLFAAHVDALPEESQGLWQYADGVTTPVALAGDPLPGYPDLAFWVFEDRNAQNAAGEFAIKHVFRNIVSHQEYDEANGILAPDAPGVLSIIALSGEDAPGIPGGIFHSGQYQDNAFRDLSVNESGRIHFSARAYIPSSGSNVYGTWATNPAGVLELLVKGGDPIPGLPGVYIDSMGVADHFDDSGRLVLFAVLGGAVTSADDRALLRLDPSAGLSVIVREGDAAPVTPPGATYGSFYEPATNDAGDLVFVANLIGGPPERAVFRVLDDVVEVIAQSDDPLPCGAYDHLDTVAAINESGEVAFTGALTPGLDGVSVVLFADTAGDVSLRAITGAAIGGPGDLSVGSLIGSPRLEDSGVITFSTSRPGSALVSYLPGLGLASLLEEGQMLDDPFGVPRAVTKVESLYFSRYDDTRTIRPEGFVATASLSDPSGDLHAIVLPEPDRDVAVAIGFLILAYLSRSRGHRHDARDSSRA